MGRNGIAATTTRGVISAVGIRNPSVISCHSRRVDIGASEPLRHLSLVSPRVRASSVSGVLAERDRACPPWKGTFPAVVTAGPTEWAVKRLKVGPYHSVRLHRHNRVYHDRTDCPTGRLIHSEALAKGTGGLRRCEQCRALDEPPSR
jgi:hypothetical protein